jgi:hypothetical protein
MVLGSKLPSVQGNVTWLSDVEAKDAKNYADMVSGMAATMVEDQARTNDPAVILAGFEGEMAFCKIHNVFHFKSSESRAWDAVVGDRYVDVKTTPVKHGSLLVKYGGEARPSELYALVIKSGRRFTYKGYTTAEQMFNPKNLGDLGYGPVWIVGQEDLVPDLVCYIK